MQGSKIMTRRVIHPAAEFDYWEHIGANAPRFVDDFEMVDDEDDEYEQKPIVNRFSPGRLVDAFRGFIYCRKLSRSRKT